MRLLRAIKSPLVYAGQWQTVLCEYKFDINENSWVLLKKVKGSVGSQWIQ